MKKSLTKFIIGIFLIIGFFAVATKSVKLKVNADDAHIHSDNATIKYTAWSQTNTLPTSGYYYLENDVTLDKTFESREDVNICLNGHGIRINGKGNVIKVTGGVLEFCDCQETEHKYKMENGLAKVDDSLTADYETFKGGYITGGNGVETGGAFYVAGGQLSIRRGVIIGNSTTGNGGAVYVENSSGSTIFEHSLIVGNVAAKSGGAIYHAQEGKQTYIRHSTTIKNNVSGQSPAGVYIAGNLGLSGSRAGNDDIYIYDNKLSNGKEDDLSALGNVEVQGLFSNSTKIGYSYLKKGALIDYFKAVKSNYNNENPNELFISSEGYCLVKNGDNAVYKYNALDYSVTYNEEPHTFKPDPDYPVENTIKYGTVEGTYDLDEAPVYTDIGEYTIYYEITTEVATIKGSQKITIADYAPEIKPYMPTPNKNMEYTGEAQELVTIPKNSNATYRFKIKDGYWSEYTPKGLEIGVYTIFIKLQIDGNDIDEIFEVKASIIEADKTVLSDKIAEATEYVDSIKADYKYIAQELFKDILSAKADVIISTKTKAEIAESTEILNQALELAKSNVKLIDDVKASINLIGDVSYTEESKAKIDAARASYDGLYDRYKTLVSNYETLTNAEARYASLKIDDEKAKAVILAIDSIGEITLDSKDKLNEVRNSYNALTDSQKNLVTNYESLENADNEYATLRANKDMAIPVEDAINAIGEVLYTEESKGKIDAARAAYDALTDPQKDLVSNYETLTNAEARYAELVTNNNLALEVEELINAIGEVTIKSKEKIDAARAAYDALTEEQKPLVTNLNILVNAETSYAVISLNKAKADAVDAKIDEIGDVTYTDECKEKIDAAKASYNVLTADQKIFVTKYEELENKEKIYKNVEYAYKVLNSIGAVELTAEYKEKIDAARNVYNALTDEEKALITNSNKLTNAEAEYQKLSDEKTSTIIKIVAITGGVLLAAILIVIYILLFYVFNSWTLIKYKKKRVFKIGRKNGKMRLLCKNFRIIYRDEVNVFKNKD